MRRTWYRRLRIILTIPIFISIQIILQLGFVDLGIHEGFFSDLGSLINDVTQFWTILTPSPHSDAS